MYFRNFRLCSLAIESQVANLEDVSDTALYLNDDFFLLKVNRICQLRTATH